MFQQISGFLSTIPFFSSVAFGIIAMVIVGSSWCLVGLVMGDAPKRGIEPSLVQMGGGIFSVLFSLMIMLVTSAYSTAPLKATFLICLTYFVGSAMNFVMLQLMSKAMQLGKIRCKKRLLFPKSLFLLSKFSKEDFENLEK